MNVFANPSESIGEDIARKICETPRLPLRTGNKARTGCRHGSRPAQESRTLEVGEQASDLMPRPPVVTVMGPRRSWQRPRFSTRSGKQTLSRMKVAASRKHIGPASSHCQMASPLRFSTRQATRRSPRCGHAARMSRISRSSSSPRTTASCRRRSRPSITPRPPRCRSCGDQTNAICQPPTRDRVKKTVAGATPQSRVLGRRNHHRRGFRDDEKSIDTLLEMILLQAEIMELKAQPGKFQRRAM